MLSGKVISSFEILRNFLRDNPHYSQVFSYADAIEYISECLDLIACPAQLSNDMACIEIEEYRGKLPCNYYLMTQCSGLLSNNQQFAIRETSGTFHPVFACSKEKDNLNHITNRFSLHTGTEIEEFKQTHQINNADKAIQYDENGNPFFDQRNSFMISVSGAVEDKHNKNDSFPTDPTYRLSDNFIFTNFKRGRILMAYKAYPLDKEGFPLIPDNIKYKQACQWYITKKFLYKGWIKGEVSDTQFKYVEEEYNFYVTAAQGAGKTPSLDKLESYRKMFQRLIPLTDLHSKFFNFTEERTSIGQRNFSNGNAMNTHF